ncbi:hypothetical protein LOAG_03883 [Loa loa]|uniref:Uncharacterized protein n=1 Tax=Loa loa TaxID=7209 RepID=A0A1S0U3N3_LOALO|nr:hypothetical protein LOAG_03883 [Loa loa]EFO24604.1 hypothetical protein LOAG_03883 [Loa loa]
MLHARVPSSSRDRQPIRQIKCPFCGSHSTERKGSRNDKITLLFRTFIFSSDISFAMIHAGLTYQYYHSRYLRVDKSRRNEICKGTMDLFSIVASEGDRYRRTYFENEIKTIENKCNLLLNTRTYEKLLASEYLFPNKREVVFDIGEESIHKSTCTVVNTVDCWLTFCIFHMSQIQAHRAGRIRQLYKNNSEMK